MVPAAPHGRGARRQLPSRGPARPAHLSGIRAVAPPGPEASQAEGQQQAAQQCRPHGIAGHAGEQLPGVLQAHGAGHNQEGAAKEAEVVAQAAGAAHVAAGPHLQDGLSVPPAVPHGLAGSSTSSSSSSTHLAATCGPGPLALVPKVAACGGGGDRDTHGPLLWAPCHDSHEVVAPGARPQPLWGQRPGVGVSWAQGEGPSHEAARGPGQAAEPGQDRAYRGVGCGPGAAWC